MLEKTFQAHVLRRLREAGGPGLWIPYPRTRYANAGVADLVCVTAAVELKAPGSKYGITATQQAFLDRLTSLGGQGKLITSFEELEEFIRARDSLQKTTP